MLPELRLTRIALLAGAALSACTAEGTSIAPTGEDAGTADAAADAGPRPDASGPPFAPSTKGRVRFKGAERMRNDFAQALDLAPGEVCAELGQYDCVEFVHRVALGGTEPYTLGITRPLDKTTATTPLAVERVALSACGRRVDADLADPARAVLFGELEIEGGAVANLESEAVTRSLTRLYRRALLRNPTESELSHLRELHRALEQDGLPNVARDWAVLTCFSVLTSMEGLFY